MVVVVAVDRAGGDAGTDGDQRHVVAVLAGHIRVVVGVGAALVADEDEQRVVRLRPLRIAGEIGLIPGVAVGDGAVVAHVVLCVGRDEADLRQVRVVARERGEIGRVRRRVGELAERVVPAGVQHVRGQPLEVALDRHAGGHGLAGQRGGRRADAAIRAVGALG